MKQVEGVNAIGNAIFSDYKSKYLFRYFNLLLDIVYNFLVFTHSEYSATQVILFFLAGTSAISTVARGWSLMTEHKEFIRFEHTITRSMQEFRFEDGKEEDCGICMEKMKVARKLRCNHCFHQYCLMQMILNKKTTCPICREDIYHGVPAAARRHVDTNPRVQPVPAVVHEPQMLLEREARPEPRVQPAREPAPGLNIRLNQNVIGNLMQNVFLPFNLGGNVPQVGEAEIERVREIYTDIPREQIVQEILRAGSVEQAIINIAERL